MSLTTHWTEIRQLAGNEQAAAWQAFVARYRDFVGATLRRLIWSPSRADAARDEFWGYLFASDVLTRLQPPMRFRAFLSGTLRNFANGWRRRDAPAASPLRNDDAVASGASLLEDEEIVLWGRQLLHLALRRLERTQPRQGAALRRFYGLSDDALADPVPRVGATALAAAMELSPNAIHQLLFRARQGLRDCLLEEIRQTVSTRPDLQVEFDLVFAALNTTNPGLLGPEPS